MKFGNPEFFLLLLLIPLLVAGAILTSRKRSGQWTRLVAKRLRPLLLHPRSQVRRWCALGAYMLALLLLIVALTSPNAGYRETPDTVRGRNIMIAIDVSRSMFAEDSKPNRFRAAKASALELIDRFPNDRIGVIAFSGTTWVEVPLTIDHFAVRDSLQRLDYPRSGKKKDDWVSREGSDLGSAVRLAIRNLRETGQRDNTLVILSDGETHTGGVDQAAHEAELAGLTIFSAGFGTKNGTVIPDSESPDKQFYDRSGTLVITKLESAPLVKLARETGGVYTEGAGRNFLAKLEVAVQRLERFEIQGRKRRIAIPRFQWFLGPSMLLFMVGMILNSSFRFQNLWSPKSTSAVPSRTALLFLLASLLCSPASQAGLIPQTPAERAFAQEDYEIALALFGDEIDQATGGRRPRLQLGAAAAAYRLRKYSTAAKSYSGALLSKKKAVQEQAHFGLGNTQYYKGLELEQSGTEIVATYWRDSIAHYEEVLALNPTNKRAEENRDYVSNKLDDLLEKREPQPDPEQGHDPPEPDPNQPKPEKDPDQDPKNGGNDPKPSSDPKGTPENPIEPPKNPKDPPQNPEDNGSGNQNDEDPPENGAIKPRPGESPEEFARRVLNDNADFEMSPMPRRGLKARRPKKDW